MTFAFVSMIIYKLENWPILADYLVKSAGRFLYFNCLSKNKIQRKNQWMNGLN